MALTLSAELQAAQDGQAHRPICELMSLSMTEALPLIGQALTSTTTAADPDVFTHSSGRLLAVYQNHVALKDTLHYVYTDVARTEFTTVTAVTMGADGDTIEDIAIVELVGGNVGILYTYISGTTKYLVYEIITVTGTAVSTAVITSWSTATYWSDGLDVIRLANDTYLAVYCKWDGSAYQIYKLTSSNFTAWTGPTALSIAGLDAAKKRREPSLTQIDTGEVWLWFGYAEATGATGEILSNVYHSISADNGATWAAAVKLTAYDGYGAIARYPVAVQKAANQQHLIYTEVSGSLKLENDLLYGGSIDYTHPATQLHYDPVSGYLYCMVTRYVNDALAEINTTTWAVDRIWKAGSVPAWNSFYSVWEPLACTNALVGSGRYRPFSSRGALGMLNATTNVFTDYAFDDYTWYDGDYYGLSKNVTGYSVPASYSTTVKAALVDETSRRLYVFLRQGYSILSETFYEFGWIDLDSAGPSHTWNKSFEVGSFSLSGGSDWGSPMYDVCIDPDADLMMWSSGSANCELVVFSIAAGARLRRYTNSGYPDFPYGGITSMVHVDGYVYFTFVYNASYNPESRGLGRISLTDDTVTYYRPTWATLDSYGLGKITVIDSGAKLMIAGYYGITIFDVVTEQWTLYDNAAIPGLTGDGADQFICAVMDETSRMIYAATAGEQTTWTGLVGFLEAGFIQWPKYLLGEYTTSWAWAAALPFVSGHTDGDVSVCLDPDDNSIFAFWTHYGSDTSDIWWDKESAAMDLAPLLITGTDLVAEWSVDDSPNRLSFELSHGHLFDQHNSNSLWRPYLAKGRRLTLRQGETVSAVDYWASQGKWVVTETALSYKRGDYPSVRVTALCDREFLARHQVVASEYLTYQPDAAIEQIVTGEMGWDAGMLDIPALAGGFVLNTQFVHTSVGDMVDTIANRFGYFAIMGMDGKLTLRPITVDGATAHAYGDTTKLIDFTPDDTFSDFTNQVTVTGEEQDYTQGILAEEQVAERNGTMGWWGCKNTIRIYYSEDQQRRCIEPRLEQVEIPAPLFGLAGSVSVSLSASDPGYQWVEITISAPDLRPALAAALALYLVGNKIPDIAPSTGGPTWPVGRWAESAGLMACMMILGSVANWQFRIHAAPLSYFRRSVQATADDLLFQAQIGQVIGQQIDGWCCYSQSHCQEVADFELLLLQLQRRRVRFSKVGHLQDEVGDTITIKHPYTGATIKLFVAALKRIYRQPEAGSTDGGLVDSIEGWVL